MILVLLYGTASYLFGAWVMYVLKKQEIDYWFAKWRKESKFHLDTLTWFADLLKHQKGVKKPMKMNLNNLATIITKEEGKKHAVNIADVKEIMKLTFKHLAKWNIIDLADTLKAYKK